MKMVSTEKIKLIRWLSYAGALPFMLGIISPFISFEIIDSYFLLSTYGALIVSFLCGIHWAISVFFDERSPQYLLIVSNIVTLISWVSLSLPSFELTMLIQSFCFMFLLALDKKLFNLGLYPMWYYELRRNVTTIVVVLLTLSMVLS
jgi:Protein of unknown function (DUF3429)